MTNLEFEKHYTNNYNALLSFAKRFVNNLNDAEDLVQETAFKAYKSRNSFKQGTSFKSWTFTILRNTFITKYNRRKKKNLVSKPVEELVYAADAKVLTMNTSTTSLELKEIDQCLSILSDKCREPLEMHLDGFQYDEIANHLNIPIGTVKSRINFARTKLRNNSILLELKLAS